MCRAQKNAAATAASRGGSQQVGGPSAERHYLNVAAECAIVGGSARSTLNFLAALDMAPQRSLSIGLQSPDGHLAAYPVDEDVDSAADHSVSTAATSAGGSAPLATAGGSPAQTPTKRTDLQVTLPAATSPSGIPPDVNTADLLLGSGQSSVFELGLGLEPFQITIVAH